MGPLRAVSTGLLAVSTFVLVVLARGDEGDLDARATTVRMMSTMNHRRQSSVEDSDDAWRRGSGDARTLVRYNNHARRILHASAPGEAWDAAGRFLERLDGALGDERVNGGVLHEFNDLTSVRGLDVSVRVDYHASLKSGVLERLGTCDRDAKRADGEAWCMGLETSRAFVARHQRWWRRLVERYGERGHPYWLSEYMEFDMSEGEIDPTASVFLEHATSGTRRHGEYVDAVREYLDATGVVVKPRLFDNVRAVIDVAMNGEFDTHVWAAGIMFSRSMEAKGGVIESVRLLIQFTRHAPRDDAETADDGYRSEKTRQMVHFLELLHWTGDFDEFDRIDDHFLDDGGLGSVLQVDVLDVEPAATAPSVIGPRVGVEISVGVTDRRKNILPRLDVLVDAGLTSAAWWREFADALCARGPPAVDASTARAPVFRPCAVRRRTSADKVELFHPTENRTLPMLTVAFSHVKFVVQPGRPLYAKTYVVTQHGFKYCHVDRDEYAHANATPRYELCAR